MMPNKLSFAVRPLLERLGHRGQVHADRLEVSLRRPAAVFEEKRSAVVEDLCGGMAALDPSKLEKDYGHAL